MSNKLLQAFRSQTKHIKFCDFLETLTVEEISKLARQEVNEYKDTKAEEAE